jgi:hypothetical protein
MTHPELTADSAWRKALRLRTVRALAFLAVAALAYRFLVVGDNWAADRVWRVVPMHWRVSHLADKVLSSDPARSRQAQAALLALRSQQDITALIDCAAARDVPPDDRATPLCDILARIGAPAAMPLLKAAARAQKGMVAEMRGTPTRLKLLSSIMSFLSDANRKRFASMSSVSLKALGSMGKPATRPLMQVFTPKADADECNLAISALAMGKDPDAVTFLVALASSTPAMRREVLYMLSSVPTPAAADFLFQEMTSAGTMNPLPGGNFDFAYAAVALGKLQDPRAISGLIGVVRSANSPFKTQSATLLGSYHGRGVEAALAAALNDPDDGVSAAAARSLQKIGTPFAKDALAKRKPGKDNWRQ